MWREINIKMHQKEQFTLELSPFPCVHIYSYLSIRVLTNGSSHYSPLPLASDVAKATWFWLDPVHMLWSEDQTWWDCSLTLWSFCTVTNTELRENSGINNLEPLPAWSSDKTPVTQWTVEVCHFQASLGTLMPTDVMPGWHILSWLVICIKMSFMLNAS